MIHSYESLYKREIGIQFAILYVNWSDCVKRTNSIRSALKILQMGLENKAEPRLTLSTQLDLLKEEEKASKVSQQDHQASSVSTVKTIAFFDDGHVKFNKKVFFLYSLYC
jgi:hypothetical protein